MTVPLPTGPAARIAIYGLQGLYLPYIQRYRPISRNIRDMGLYRCICLCTALYLPMYSPYTDIPLYTLCAALLYIGCIAVFAYIHRYRACIPYIPCI